jgi:protein phosphatase
MRARSADGGSLVQLTEDHTYEHLVAEASAVPNLPGKITRFLDGREDGRSPDLTPLSLCSGDRILLCSDGLSSYVPEERIGAVLNSSGAVEQVAERLIALALDHGGRDNVTVCIIDVTAAPQATQQ